MPTTRTIWTRLRNKLNGTADSSPVFLYQFKFNIIFRLLIKHHTPIRLIFRLKKHGRAGCVAALVLGDDEGRSVRAADNAYCRRRFAAWSDNPARFFRLRAVATEVAVERALIKDLVFFLHIKTSSCSRARATRRRAAARTSWRSVSACRFRAAFQCGQRATARRLCLSAPRILRSFRA